VQHFLYKWIKALQQLFWKFYNDNVSTFKQQIIENRITMQEFYAIDNYPIDVTTLLIVSRIY
jgi:hypothetical protein